MGAVDTLTSAVFLVCLATHGLALKSYQSKIPNGDNIPHPCKANYRWGGVGHQNMGGGGVRNPFGEAFAAQGRSWTADLCNADSDGDGRTNGEELGDPSCVWTEGSIPAATSGLSHPGVCEPTNSTDCISKNGWEIDCSEGADFACEGVDAPETQAVTMAFARTLVPAVETTYICQAFDIPGDREYHIIGWKPEIDNADVMHHTLIYGCPAGIDGFDQPRGCGMVQNSCTVLLGGWTLGSSGSCVLPNQGFLAGQGHYTKIVMEHHWNNPGMVADYYDSSGLTLYMTPTLRPNNLGMLITGQQRLEIPPGRLSWTVESNCPAQCTSRKIGNPVYITSAHLHMHYLGAYGAIQHWRDGALLNTLFNEEIYSYDTPVFLDFAEPIEFQPGDELKTVCGFSSLSKNDITYTGDATSDEMCYGFLTYYPAEAKFDTCVSYENLHECAASDFYEKTRRSAGQHWAANGYLTLAAMIAYICG